MSLWTNLFNSLPLGGATSNALESRYHRLTLLFVTNGEMDYNML